MQLEFTPCRACPALRDVVAVLRAENALLRRKLSTARMALSQRSKLRVCREIVRRKPVEDHRCNMALPPHIKRKMRLSGGCYPMTDLGAGYLVLMRCEALRLFESIRKTDGCWEWQGPPNPKTGYGTFNWDTRGWMAHRFVYAVMVGPITFGLTLDHTCHSTDPTCPGGLGCAHRRCVNPAHMEQITLGDNCRRQGRAMIAAS